MKTFLTARKPCALLTLLVAALCGAIAAPRTAAIDTGRLPDFSVTALDGRTVASADLAADAKWLLVYAEANCRTCEQLYDAFRREQPGVGHDVKVVVLVGGATTKEVERIAKRVGWIDRSSWYADPDKRSAAALRVKGTPVVHGIQDGKIVWDLAGVLPDAKTLTSLLENWYAPQPAPQPPGD